MRPPVDRRFPCLNAVRAVAALGVVATHTAFDTGEVNRGWHGAVLSRLDFGVTLFFVLSGFLLARPFFLARAMQLPHPSYRHFLWKRGLRILPLYWVTVLLALTLLPANQGADLATWLRQLTLTQIYVPGLLSAGLTQMWSLCTEVAFYAVLPALCWALVVIAASGRWRPLRVLGAIGVMALAGVAWQVVAASGSPVGAHYAQWLPGFLPWFGVGMAFAVMSADLRVHPRRSPFGRLDVWGADLPGCWLLAFSVFAVACTPLCGPRLLTAPTGWEAFFKCVLYTVSATFLVLPLVFGPETDGRVRRAMAGRVPTWFGDISYGIFCLHLLALDTILRVLDIPVFTGRFQDVLVLTVASTVAIAAASYYGLERPFLRLKNSGPFAKTSAAPRASAATIST